MSPSNSGAVLEDGSTKVPLRDPHNYPAPRVRRRAVVTGVQAAVTGIVGHVQVLYSIFSPREYAVVLDLLVRNLTVERDRAQKWLEPRPRAAA